MDGWAVSGNPGGPGRLVPITRDTPEPAADEVLIRVRVCGVCRTDLHLADHDLAPKREQVIPGHEVVGEVVELGQNATRFSAGDRIGIAWLRRTCGTCDFCQRGQENLCHRSEYTGWDADGGFAEYAVVPEAFAYALPNAFSDEEVAPLLCSGIIGYRALRRAQVPPNGRLGIYGFGASAHLTAQVAVAEGREVHVVTRGEKARRLALELGAASASALDESPPVKLDGAILFAPVGDLVPPAMSALEQGATLAIAGIHLTDIPALNYQEHLFRERTLTSVTANTRTDGEELLEKAAEHRVRAHVTPYGFDDVDQALTDLANGDVSGAAVVRVS
jgi:propanol-preferring alcohol dehydrogenase